MQKPLSISIIGMGAVGRALMAAALEKGIQVNEWSSRSFPSGMEELRATYVPLNELKEITGEIAFITVTDDAVSETAVKLAKQAVINSKVVVHCSGNLPSAVLDVFESEHTAVASFHPIQSFAGAIEGNPFRGIYIDIEGKAAEYEILNRLASILEANVIRVSREEKIALHVAASMASNYLVALLDSASDAAVLEGGDKDLVLKALIPLVQTTLDNIQTKGIGHALTGPIVRGDVQTVEDHIDFIERDSDLCKLYKALGERALSISMGTQRINKEQAKRLSEILHVIE